MDYLELEVWKEHTKKVSSAITEMGKNKDSLLLQKKIYEGKVAESIVNDNDQDKAINEEKLAEVNKKLIELSKKLIQTKKENDELKNKIDERIEFYKNDPEIKKQINKGLIIRFERKNRDIKAKTLLLANFKKVVNENPDLKKHYNSYIKASIRYNKLLEKKNSIYRECQNMYKLISDLRKDETNKNESKISEIKGKISIRKNDLKEIIPEIKIAESNLKNARIKVKEDYKNINGIQIPPFETVSRMTEDYKGEEIKSNSNIDNIIRSQAMIYKNQILANNYIVEKLHDENSIVLGNSNLISSDPNQLKEVKTVEAVKQEENKIAVKSKQGFFKRFWSRIKYLFTPVNREEKNVENDNMIINKAVLVDSEDKEEENLKNVAQNVENIMKNKNIKEQSTPSFVSKTIRDMVDEKQKILEKEAAEQFKLNNKQDSFRIKSNRDEEER